MINGGTTVFRIFIQKGVVSIHMVIIFIDYYLKFAFSELYLTSGLCEVWLELERSDPETNLGE